MATVAAALGICCGLPVLASLGVLGFLAGLSTTSWVLVVLGAVASGIGGWRFFGRRRRAGVGFTAPHTGRSRQRIVRVFERPTLPKEQ